MVEYINRDALLQEIEQESRASKNSFPRQYFVVGDVLTCIRTAHAADVAEVRHGRWIDVSGESSNLNWKCSLCTKRVLQKSPYCPNCGVRMGKEEDHDKHPSDPV